VDRSGHQGNLTMKGRGGASAWIGKAPRGGLKNV
jgi:hypothetical protein